jgi:bacterioferritin
MTKHPFLTDVELIRTRARTHMERGAVTHGYNLDRGVAIDLLNDALATELVCVARYKRHYFMVSGIDKTGLAAELLEHAEDEQRHADMICARIVQLGGAPELDPSKLLGRSHSEYVEGTSLADMLKEDLIAERVAIDTYREMIAFFAGGDSTSRRMLEEILAKEEEHAEDIASLLADALPHAGQEAKADAGAEQRP